MMMMMMMMNCMMIELVCVAVPLWIYIPQIRGSDPFQEAGYPNT
jgi:hypothetical protein